MNPTEHELTVATEAIARTDYEAYRVSLASPQRMLAWDDLPQFARHGPLERALPAAVAALNALPDRSAAALTEAAERIQGQWPAEWREWSAGEDPRAATVRAFAQALREDAEARRA